MRDRQFDDFPTRSIRQREQLGVDHRPIATKRKFSERFPANNFVGAIDVFDAERKKSAREPIAHVRVEFAVPEILPRDAVPDDRIVIVHLAQKFRELLKTKLTVRIGEKNQIALRGVEAGPQRRAVPAIMLVPDYANRGMARP
jgi:hypothetical protein